MVDIQSATAENRRGKKKIEADTRNNHRTKIQWPALFHRAAINRKEGGERKVGENKKELRRRHGNKDGV